MLRIVLIILVAMSPVGALHAALPDDPALSKPVTLAVKGEALSDIMPLLQDQTGVHLRVARNIADQKATIFVDENPLRDVMAGLTMLFRYQWTGEVSEGRKVYELWEDEKTRREREEQWQKASVKAWEAALAEMKLKDRFGRMTKAQRESYRTKLMGDMAKGGIKDGLAQLDALNAVEQEPTVGPIASLVVSSPKVLKALQDGMSVHYDLDSPEPEWKLSQSVGHALLEAKARTEKPDSKIAGIDPESIKLRINSYGPQAIDVQYSGMLSYRPEPSHLMSSGYNGWLAYERIASYLELPKDYLPQVHGANLDQKLSLGIGDFSKEASLRPKEDGSGSALVNRSDVLEVAHKKLGLQVISDHYSYWYLWGLPKEGTIRGILEGFKNQIGPAGFYAYEAVWGSDGKYLYARTKDVRYSDAAEIPNRLLGPWQQTYAKQGSLGLDDLCQIAQLSEPQVQTVRRGSKLLGLGDSVRINGALRFYGMLTPRQKDQARGNGTRMAELTVEQRAELDQLMGGTAALGGVGIYKDGSRVDRAISVADEVEDRTVLVRGPESGGQADGPRGSASSASQGTLQAEVEGGSFVDQSSDPNTKRIASSSGKYLLIIKSRTASGATREAQYTLMEDDKRARPRRFCGSSPSEAENGYKP